MKGYLFLTDKNGKRIHLDRNGLRIGRKKDNQLIISKESVSNHHAQLIWMENRMYLVDNKSKGGVYVNGRKVRGRAALRPGDMITIGGGELPVQFQEKK